MVDLVLPVDDQGEGRGLYAADGEHLPVLPIAQGIEPGGVHAQQPVADGPREARLIELVEGGLVLELLEPLADRLLGQRRDPEAVDRASATCLLHDPPLDQLALLAGITAVDHHLGPAHQLLDRAELLLVRGVVDQLDTEAGRDHGQGGEAPVFPALRILVRLLERAEMAKGPGDLVPVSLQISVLTFGGAQYLGDLAGDTRFLGNTNFHRQQIPIYDAKIRYYFVTR